ncbi:small integral membrane protein 4 [Pseudomyrmex gracilis]|uniref:small integral membrane protein 4 n=1 Tax=Pseudomyrmex gracilis TaxID=219809 RepID=UPI000994F2F4|nr:small integral membrane protein 4 [Pseudomyrmex gracilis]
MKLIIKTFTKLINKVPGKRIFGEFRFLPIFFILGATLEYSMIHWHVGEVNFYKTYKRRRVEELVEKRLQEELEQQAKS